MAALINISEAARDVLRRSTITATTVALPPEQLPRALYTEVDKALNAAGGKWNRKQRVHVFERDPRAALGLTIESGKAVNHKQVKQAFYTPDEVTDRIMSAAIIECGMTVLEPSCGEGSIIRAVLRWEPYVERIVGVDTDADALDRIGIDPRVTLETRDFLAMKPTAFDRVVMNPPFSKGQDIAHVTHALRFVVPRGRLVAIMSPSWRTSESKKARAFRALLDQQAEWRVEEIEAGTFKASGTMVATVMLVVRVAG